MKPIILSTQMVQAILAGRKTQTRRVAKKRVFIDSDHEILHADKTAALAPYKVGDILWVRETWRADPGTLDTFYRYKASEEFAYGNWRPSIHMPRKAARLFLRVTNVRAERLQDITDVDIAAEGLPSYIIPPGHEHYKDVDHKNWLGFEWFQELWDGINAKRGYSWESNPFVWVYEFERTEARDEDM